MISKNDMMHRFFQCRGVMMTFGLLWLLGPIAQAGDGPYSASSASGRAGVEQESDWLTWIAASNGGKSKSWFPTWSPFKSSKSTGSSLASQSSYSKNNKTTWQKMSMTSKRWWRKTAEFLDPYAPPKPTPGVTSKSSGSNWLTGWMKPKEENNIETVPEFLKQGLPK